MALAYPTVEWVEEFKKQINFERGLQKGWSDHGRRAVALVTSASRR